MKNLEKIFTSFSIFILYIIAGIIFNGNHKWMILFVLIGTFFISLILFKRHDKTETKKIFTLFILPPIMIFLLLSFFSSFIYTTAYMVFIPLTVYFAYNFHKKQNLLKLLFVGGFFSFAAFIFLPNQIVYFDNVQARKIRPFNGLTLMDINKQNVKLDTNKVIVLDFWNTACKVCFEKFPEYEKQYLAYKSNPNILFYSVNVPLKRDSLENTISLIKRLDYKFPTLFAVNQKEIARYKIYSYPHILIIKNNEIRYSGRLEFENKILIYNFKNEIEKNLTIQ